MRKDNKEATPIVTWASMNINKIDVTQLKYFYFYYFVFVSFMRHLILTVLNWSAVRHSNLAVCCNGLQALYQLPTPTSVVWEGFYFRLSVCLFVFFARYLKNRCSCEHQTWHRNVPRWMLEKNIYFGSKCQKLRSRVTKSLPAWVFALSW